MNSNRLDLLDWLLERGAEPNQKDWLGRTPFELATQLSMPGVAQRLAEVQKIPFHWISVEEVTDFKSLKELIYGLLNDIESGVSAPGGERHEATLEEFLRSLWKVTRFERDQPLTWSRIATFLVQAFNTSPLPYDSAWAAYKSEPLREEAASDFDYFRGVILSQIQDLHRLREEGAFKISATERQFGLQGWYNWDVDGYLDCGLGGMGDGSRYSPTWEFLGILLYLGRIYE